MKVGDLIRYKKWNGEEDLENRIGVIVNVDCSHRQKTVTVMNSDGLFVEKVWVGLIEVVNDRLSQD